MRILGAMSYTLFHLRAGVDAGVRAHTWVCSRAYITMYSYLGVDFMEVWGNDFVVGICWFYIFSVLRGIFFFI